MSEETAAELVERLTREGLESLRDDVAHGRRDTGLKSLDERGAMSEIVRDQYTGRYPLELIQNANDAEASEGSTGGQVKFVVTDTALLVADQGAGFGIDQVNAICGLARSSKDPRKNIGYKGLGFKSVREITDRPQIISDGVRFGFDAERLRRSVEEIAGQLPKSQRLPDYAFPFPLADSDLGDDLQAVEGLLSEGFRTVMRLPFREPDLRQKVAEHVSAVATSRLLVFLDAAESLEIQGASIDSEARAIREERGDHEYLVLEEAGGIKEYLIFRRQFDVPDRTLIEGLGRAWQDVESVRAVAAVPLGPDGLPRGGQPEPIYVYFPTEEDTGFSVALHADFQMDLDRRRIGKSMHAAPYNDWLRGRLVEFVAEEVVPWLAQRFGGTAVLNALAAHRTPTGEGAILRRDVLTRLRDTDFVPCRDGLRSPAEARVLPSAVPDLDAVHSWLPAERPYVVPAAEHDLNVRALLTTELGVAAVSTPSLLADLLPPSDEQEVRDFYGVLVDWRKRDGWFARYLSLARCVRLRGGEWISPNQPAFLPRQRNESDFPAELQIPIVEVPDVEGLEELLQEAGVKPLAWRTLVLDFLMPILSEARGASVTRGAAMTALRIYYDSMRTESGDQDIRDAVRKALLPARSNVTPDDQQHFQEAGDLYFGTDWLGESRLEVVYGPFRRPEFLDIRVPLDPDNARADRAFYTWLGVADRPRLRISRDPNAAPVQWRSTVEFADAARDPQRHPDSQDLFDPGVDRLHTLVRIADRTRLIALWNEIAQHWAEYATQIAEATWHCKAGAHKGDRDRRLASSAAFALRQMPCIPSVKNEQPTLASARDIWRPAPDTPARVRRLLQITDPALGSVSAGMAEWLGFVDGSAASAGDLADLLRHLARATDPDRGMEVPDVEAALWLLRRLNTAWGTVDADQNSDVPILAVQGGVLQLAARPHLVVDPVLAEVWSDVVPLYRGDRDLHSLFEGLDLPVLDREVEITPVAGLLQPDEADKVRNQLAEIGAEIVALAGRDVPSRVAEISARLHSLSVICTSDLALEYRFGSHAPRMNSGAKVHFSTTGVVYLRVDDDGPDWSTLGLRLADYLEVEIGSALAALLITPDREIRTRFLEAHGIGGEDILRAEQAFLDVGEASATDSEPQPVDEAGDSCDSAQVDDLASDHLEAMLPNASAEPSTELGAGSDRSSHENEVAAGRDTSLTPSFKTDPSARREARAASISDQSAESLEADPLPPRAATFSVGDAVRAGRRQPDHSAAPDDSRFYSYVVAAGTHESRMATRAEAEAMRIGVLGVDRVVEFEGAAGRLAVPQSHSNKGFDVVSALPDGQDRRIIEVKATTDAWPQRGIPVSRSQMEKNREMGQEFWLYVVEYAGSPDRARVLPIQDPGSAVDYFVFDPGWRNLATGDQT